MQAKNVISLRNIIKRKSAEFGLRQLAYSPQVIYLAAPQELFHLMTELTSPVAPSLPLQLYHQGTVDR